VGVAIGVLLILAAIMVLFFRRRRTATRQHALQEYAEKAAWERSELDGSEVRRELDGSQRGSVKGKPVPQEIVELE
jgi:hypothetical protein